MMWFISDLHISHDSSTLGIEKIHQVLSHILNCRGEKIVFNGDTFDFARTNILPEDYKSNNKEKKYGLDSSEENAVFKMRIIISNNQYFFDLLNRLIKDGFILYFIYGNHDYELRFAKVQNLIASRIDAVLGKNLFFDFRYRDESFFVEHGHQYDPENRLVYEAHLYPEEYSFGYITTKYFGNIIEKEMKLPRNDISAGEYFVWVFKNFGFKAFWLIFQYFLYAIRVVLRCNKKEIFSNVTIKDCQAIPIMSSLFKTINRLYLIQVTLFIVSFVALILTPIIYKNAFYLSVAGFVSTLFFLFRINNKGRVHKLLESAGKRLKEEYNLKHIVFGHNHYFDRDISNIYLSSIILNQSDGIYVLSLVNDRFLYQKI